MLCYWMCQIPNQYLWHNVVSGQHMSSCSLSHCLPSFHFHSWRFYNIQQLDLWWYHIHIDIQFLIVYIFKAIKNMMNVWRYRYLLILSVEEIRNEKLYQMQQQNLFQFLRRESRISSGLSGRFCWKRFFIL